LRLFVAVDIPETQRVSLHRALEPLKPLLPGVRWTSPESWHVTLKFLGEVPEGGSDEVGEVLEEVLAKVSPFRTALTEPGVFPGLRWPRVLWMGLSDENHAFRNLAGRMERKFEKLGFPKEGRSFRPHLTLARIGNARRASRGIPAEPSLPLDAEGFLRDFALQPLDRSEFPVSEVVLFRSHLTRGGSVYEPQMRFSLHRPIRE
jgi:2'-5' RNA ligase